jgi:hypothetical protein
MQKGRRLKDKLDPEAVVQRQLDAYNDHDTEALMAIYAEDANLFEHPSKLLASGSAQLRERYVARFKDLNLQAALNRRMVMGHFVIDHETVTQTFPEGTGRLELLALYEVQKGRIANAWFIFGPKTLDSQP